MLAAPAFPPDAHHERDYGERRMPDEQERHRIAVDRADRALIEQAAAQLRTGAIRAGEIAPPADVAVRERILRAVAAIDGVSPLMNGVFPLMSGAGPRYRVGISPPVNE